MKNDHKRINEKLSDYWEQIRADRNYPSEKEFLPENIADIWDHCFLVQVNPGHDVDHGYRYSYLGKALIDAFGDDVSGQEVGEILLDTSANSFVEAFEKVIKDATPVVTEGEFTNKNAIIIKYRSCMLPLSGVGDKIDYIIGGMNWKAF